MKKIAYLGPSGSFAEAALRSMPVSGASELVPAASVQAALEAVRSGTADAALEGQQTDARFGRELIGLGDVNADGFDDVAIAA